MTITAAPPVNFDMGRVISAGFGLLVRRPVPILLIAVIFGYLPGVAIGWSTVYFQGPAPQSGAAPDFVLLLQRLGVLELVTILVAGVTWILGGGVAIVATTDAAGRSDEAGAQLTKGLRRAPLIFVAGIAATLAIFLGTLLLIVPGILLSLAWMLGPAVGGVEGQGFMGIFKRSAELTRGHRGALFGLAFLLSVVSFVSSLALRALVGAPMLGGAAAQPELLTYVLQPALSAVIASVWACVNAAAYLELRGVKEGLTSGGLASVFD